MTIETAIADGFKDELRAKLAAPPSMTPASGVAGIYQAIHEANQVGRAFSEPARLGSLPRPFRPFARLVSRLARAALMPQLSRQQDFNHFVIVALERLTRELERNGRR
ncbi:MAG: hypothetical protein AB7G15_20815 [Alphaproteobacteria bacterium]